MRILLVEDDAITAEMICAAMQKWEQEIVLTTTGEEAVQAARRQPFDLVLLDIMLPDGFGYDFIPGLRARQADLKVITMTGYNTPEMEKRARRHGIAYYMAKPINFGELKDIVDHISNKTAA